MKKVMREDLYELVFPSALQANEHNQIAYIQTSMNKDKNKYEKKIYLLAENKQFYEDESLSSYIWCDDYLLVQHQYDEVNKQTPFYYVAMDGEKKDAFSLPYDVQSIKKMNDYFIIEIKENIDDQNSNTLFANDNIIVREIPYWDNGEGFIAGKRNHLVIIDELGKDILHLHDTKFQVNLYDVKANAIAYTGHSYSDKKQICDGLYYLCCIHDEPITIVEPDCMRIDQLSMGEKGIFFSASSLIPYGNEQAPALYYYDFETKEIKCILADGYYQANTICSDSMYGKKTSFQCYNNMLYYIKTKETRSKLYTIDKFGNERCIDEEANVVTSFCLANDVLYVSMVEKTGLEEIYVYHQEKSQITSLNTNYIQTHSIQKPQEIFYNNSQKGWVIYPYDYDESKSYPAVLSIHGGPRAAFGDVFFHEMQCLSSQGYFVFYTNPRGSDSFGEEYADLRGKYGTIDYDDLMSFTNAVLDCYSSIDVRRLGVIGGSYGGFMCNWIIGHTNLFSACVTQRSVANWISDFGTSCIGYTFDPNEMQTTPWQDVNKMWFHSPMAYADKITTPTLVLHSLEDFNCPLQEALQMFTSLKYFGVPSRMCLFKGENHELSRGGKPSNRMQRLFEIESWLRQYLVKN